MNYNRRWMLIDVLLIEFLCGVMLYQVYSTNKRTQEIELKIDGLNKNVVEVQQAVANLCDAVHHQWDIVKKFDEIGK